MGAGFESYGDDGRLKFSSSMVGFFCRRTGNGNTTTRQFGNTVVSQILLNLAGFTQPMVAIRMPGYSAAFASRQGDNLYFATDAPVGTAFTYFAYDRSSSLPVRTSGVGLEVYNEAAQKTFDSAYHALRVMALLQPPSNPMFSNSGDSFTDNTGRVMAGGTTTFAGFSKPQQNGFTCFRGGVGTRWDGGSCPDLRYANRGILYGVRVSSDTGTVNAQAVSYDSVTTSYGSVTSGKSPDDITAENGWEVGAAVFAVDVTYIPIGATFF